MKSLSAQYLPTAAVLGMKTLDTMRELLHHLLEKEHSGMHSFTVNRYNRLLDGATAVQKKIFMNITLQLLAQFALKGYAIVVETDTLLSSPPLLGEKDLVSPSSPGKKGSRRTKVKNRMQSETTSMKTTKK